jgi:hypothetical protein
MANPSSAAGLHPPRLAHMFARSPSAPGTPVHSIQTMRRKAAGHGGPLTKILVANRGVRSASPYFAIALHAHHSCFQEIAIRVFRTAHELAMHSVAIFSLEDRMSAHRQKVRQTAFVLSVRHRSCFAPGRRGIPGRQGPHSRCRIPRPRRHHPHRARAWCRHDPPRVRTSFR